MRKVRQIGTINDGEFIPCNGKFYSLHDFTDAGVYRTGPEICDAWLFQDGERVFVVFNGNPPTLRWYPDVDTALVAYTLKS